MEAKGEDRMVGGEKEMGIGRRERKTSLYHGEEEKGGGGAEKEIWKQKKATQVRGIPES